jgi:hypothetical protein
VINGLSEIYLTVSRVWPEKREAYRKPIHELYDRILATAVNEHGMMYRTVNPGTGKVIERNLTDNWGYNYDGFYTIWLVDGTTEYRDAVLKALSNLKAHYTGQIWEGGSQDGYADSIEGAITLLNREPIPSAFDWVDSEIRTMWAKQKPDGVIEGWHGDGNFARTSLMYALMKTQGCRLVPWRADLRIGAVRDGKKLRLHLSAERPWSGRLLFDRPRHQTIMRLPHDYPRMGSRCLWNPARHNNLNSISNKIHETRHLHSNSLVADPSFRRNRAIPLQGPGGSCPGSGLHRSHRTDADP